MSADGTDAPPAKSSAYAPWRLPDFRRYAVSWFLMIFAKQVEMVAVNVYLYYETSSALVVGLAGLVQALPVILLAVTGGYLADHFQRRSVLIATISLSTLSACGLVIFSLGDWPHGYIYIFLAVGATGAALGGPSRAALLPQLVDLETLPHAVTWSSTIFQIATMVGPAAGGLLLLLSKQGTVALGVVATTRLLAVVALLGVTSRRTITSSDGLSLRSVAAGIRFVATTKTILATITLDLFAVLFGGATYLLPVLVKDVLKVDRAYVGFLQSAEAIGAISMAVLLAHLPPMRRPGRTMLWAVAGFGAATIGLGLSQWFWLSLLMMFLIGALDNISVIVRHTLVQVLTPDNMRGRVSAVNNIFITASNDLGGFESGLTAWLFGAQPSVVAGGIGTILVVFAASRIWPQVAKLGPLGGLRPAEVESECREDRV